LIDSPIDGSQTVHFPSDVYVRRMAFSQTIICISILCVIAAVSGVFVLKLFLISEPYNSQLTILGIAFAPIIASVANAVQIQIMNALYYNIALSLNAMENHRTDTIYEDNLIAKIFVFQCVNSYASLFYIAFVKDVVGDPCIGTCMSELSAVLSTVFLTRLLIGNLQEIIVAAISQASTEKKEMEGVPPDTIFTPIEKQFTLVEYHVMLGTFKDYAENVIQYGF